MSTKTEKFDLHQWAPTDNFLREEINENFAKLDLSALKLASGSFTGTGVAGQHVILGFKPKLLILMGAYLNSNNSIASELTFATENFTERFVDGSASFYAPEVYIVLGEDGFTLTQKYTVPANRDKYYIALY